MRLAPFIAVAAAVVASSGGIAPASAREPNVATTAVKPRLDGLADFVDGVMAQQVATREVAGAVVTVVDHGRVLFTRGYGYADVDRHVLVDPEQTVFRPGSVSKLFTWVALMQQVERGRVDLDADVNNYLDFTIPPFEGKPIRVRDLLSHSPGMSDVGGFIVSGPEKLIPYQRWIKAHVPERLWPAGTEVAYSNYGAATAGYIVERVSGEPFADYVEKHIFTPLGMTSSTFREPPVGSIGKRTATGYKLVDGRFVAKPPEYLSSIMPAGSASSTAPDMARFMLAILQKGALNNARILSAKSVAFLESDSIANAPHLPGMAHGFLVEHEAAPRLVGHAGNTVDFHSDLVIAAETGFGFFVSETGGSESSPARTELRDAIIGRVFPQAPEPRWTGREGDVPTGSYRANRRDYTKTADPAHDLQVEQTGSHRLTIETDGEKTVWEQVGPGLYEQVTGARTGGPYDRIEFYGSVDDRRMSFASQPYETYHLVPAH